MRLPPQVIFASLPLRYALASSFLASKEGEIHCRDDEKRREIVAIAGGATIRGPSRRPRAPTLSNAQPRDWGALGAHPPLDPAAVSSDASIRQHQLAAFPANRADATAPDSSLLPQRHAVFHSSVTEDQFLLRRRWRIVC